MSQRITIIKGERGEHLSVLPTTIGEDLEERGAVLIELDGLVHEDDGKTTAVLSTTAAFSLAKKLKKLNKNVNDENRKKGRCNRKDETITIDVTQRDTWFMKMGLVATEYLVRDYDMLPGTIQDSYNSYLRLKKIIDKLNKKGMK